MKHRCFSYLSPTNFKDSKANLEHWQILKVVHIFRSRMDSNRHGDWPLECKVIVEHEDVIQLLPLFPGEYSRSWNWLTTRYTLGTWGRMLPGGSWRRPLTSLEGSGMSGLPRDLQVDSRQFGSKINHDPPEQALLLSWWMTHGMLRMQPGSLMVLGCVEEGWRWAFA